MSEASTAFAIAFKEVIDSPLWALSWSDFGKPGPIRMPGDVLTLKRNGGGDVALYVGEDAGAISLSRRESIRSGLHHSDYQSRLYRPVGRSPAPSPRTPQDLAANGKAVGNEAQPPHDGIAQSSVIGETS